ncbi:hypothetical protein [Ruminococcus flavefaciens]|uniref:Uncharacterized protein n=1 Tax=Ruminococcus flavefaciens 007c TaxID=1341157 RepID=W7UIE9_RUMFL|nr:hypothetical protein [Ruminococcus flavefaciens]EWM55011.1 hypothetical protein RF007C_03170 [Ruminococcus flavefaciens 007c]
MPVFGIDIPKLSKKVLFISEENNIHKLSQYVKEIDPDKKLPLDNIYNYNIQFELSRSHFNPTMRAFVWDYLMDISWFDFENSKYPELRYFEEVIFNIMSYFISTPCFQTSLPGYIYLLSEGILPYEEICFHNFFLIDFSESPVTMEAIRHFRLDVKDSSVRFVFKDYDMSLSETFRVLISKNDFLEFLQQKHSITKIERINHAIYTVLSNL